MEPVGYNESNYRYVHSVLEGINSSFASLKEESTKSGFIGVIGQVFKNFAIAPLGSTSISSLTGRLEQVSSPQSEVSLLEAVALMDNKVKKSTGQVRVLVKSDLATQQELLTLSGDLKKIIDNLSKLTQSSEAQLEHMIRQTQIVADSKLLGKDELEIIKYIIEDDLRICLAAKNKVERSLADRAYDPEVALQVCESNIFSKLVEEKVPDKKLMERLQRLYNADLEDSPKGDFVILESFMKGISLGNVRLKITDSSQSLITPRQSSSKRAVRDSDKMEAQRSNGSQLAYEPISERNSQLLSNTDPNEERLLKSTQAATLIESFINTENDELWRLPFQSALGSEFATNAIFRDFALMVNSELANNPDFKWAKDGMDCSFEFKPSHEAYLMEATIKREGKDIKSVLVSCDCPLSLFIKSKFASEGVLEDRIEPPIVLGRLTFEMAVDKKSKEIKLSNLKTDFQLNADFPKAALAKKEQQIKSRLEREFIELVPSAMNQFKEIMTQPAKYEDVDPSRLGILEKLKTKLFGTDPVLISPGKSADENQLPTTKKNFNESVSKIDTISDGDQSLQGVHQYCKDGRRFQKVEIYDGKREYKNDELVDHIRLTPGSDKDDIVRDGIRNIESLFPDEEDKKFIPLLEAALTQTTLNAVFDGPILCINLSGAPLQTEIKGELLGLVADFPYENPTIVARVIRDERTNRVVKLDIFSEGNLPMFWQFKNTQPGQEDQGGSKHVKSVVKDILRGLVHYEISIGQDGEPNIENFSIKTEVL